MHLHFNVLPSLLALAILVAAFAAISRQHTGQRVHLWLIGWALVLVRSVTQFVHAGGIGWARSNLAIGLDSLELASIAFLVSVAPMANTWARQLLLTALLGVPTILYTNAMIWKVSSHDYYFAAILLATGGVLWLLWTWHRKLTPYVISIAAAAITLSCVLVWGIETGKEDYGVHILLACLNFLAAALYWYRMRRLSAGVLTTIFGFIGWGAVFPLGMLTRSLAPSLHIESEVWNIPKYLVALGMIVTLLEDQVQQSEHLAYHDALTGLPNRRLLRDRLAQALARAGRAGNKVAVLLLDLDDFKEVNDTFGHRIGDAALQQVVMRLASRMRASDTLARTGGDEFTIVSEVTSAPGASTLVSALESALLLPLKVEGNVIRTGVSIGFALYPDDATEAEQLCAAADKAMYTSKRSRPQRATAASSL